jgi:uncharacterized protein YgbK (DUF1537 family)
MNPVLGCIADDFTGATDLASNLVQAGMRTIQWLGVPDMPDALDEFDAVVVALKTRSIARAEAVDQSLKALQVLQALGARRFYFKYCSTFDSTDRGNIGPVAEALLAALGELQTIFCPAFPENGRTVYQGHLFVRDRLLNESGMERHPLNPMTDANLVRVLGRQATQPVGLLPIDVVERGVTAVRDGLQALRERGQLLVVTDALNDGHLRTLAAACAGMPLVTGGSGLAIGLPAAYRAAGLLAGALTEPRMPCVPGRTAILSGSCSTATQQQVSWMKARCPALTLDARRCLRDRDGAVQDVIRWARDGDPSRPSLIYSTGGAEEVASLQAELGREEAAAAIESAFARIATLLVAEVGVRRLVVAGGETSGAVVSALGVRNLRIGPRITPGVPWTESLGDRPLALALKSGNFGGPDFFETAVEMLS